MFKKYYKEANEEIIVDEVLINRVIANAHKPPVRRNQYLKYAASLAAAVFVVSAAVISMPVWQRVEEDTEVVIEKFVENTPSPTAMQSEFSEENTFPVPSPHTNATVIPPENDYDSSNITEKKEIETEQNDDSSSKAVITPAPLKEKEKIEPTGIFVLGTAPLPESEMDTDRLEETAKGEDNVTASESSVQIQSDSESAGKNAGSSSSDGSDGSGYGPIANGSNSLSSGGGAASGAFYDAPSAVNVYIPTPPGFYSTGSGSGYAYFASDSGARITVSYSSCNYSSSPSYFEGDDIITANFATGSVVYGIYAVGADMSDVEYIVNSLY